MVLFLKENGLEIISMVTEFNDGLMVPDMKVCGNIVKPTEKVNFGIMMETYSKVNGSMIKLMALEFTLIHQVLAILGSGRTIFRMGKEKNSGSMVQNIMEITN
jgi:hypothetical protein